MPGFQTHLTVSTVGSALLVAWGTARYGWDGAIPTLAFAAGAAGGMVPDLDSESSKPRRLAGLLAAASAAVAAAGFLAAPGPFLKRPWGSGPIAAAAGYIFILVQIMTRRFLRSRTRHRGLCHSLAVPFLYGGGLALLAVPRGAATAMAVWLLGIFGVFSHLLLDAAGSLSLNPLKPATADLGASTRLWAATTLVTLAAFLRLTEI
ncbi:hypothetical protein FACS189460_5400 [Deltaproteobacteria bacterium]|nr:hypothetical protein FACS189460_5400 [Deltaproteobacteria bacterium]